MQSKIESKLRLNFFLAQGLKLVGADVVIGMANYEWHLNGRTAQKWNKPNSNDFHRHIKSLAPRENKGVQPVGDNVVVDVVYYDGHVETSLASVFDWSLNIGHPKYLIDTWKPNLDALIELQEKPKVTQVKPEVDIGW